MTYLLCYRSGTGRHIAHCLLLAAIVALGCGCLNKIPAVAHYNERATKKCLETAQFPQTCKPLSYPACDPDRSCHQ